MKKNKNELLEDFVFKDPCVSENELSQKWELYGKNKYNPKVKVVDWWYHREGYPKDNDDGIEAAYKRLGTYKEDESHWISETKAAMAAGRDDTKLQDYKKLSSPVKLLNFLSYPLTLKTRKDILPEEILPILPSFPKDELTLRYTTTNQSQFRPLILPD